MEIKELYNECGNGGECPKILQSEDGDYLVQGYVLGNEVKDSTNAPCGEDLVILPKAFFERMLKSLATNIK